VQPIRFTRLFVAILVFAALATVAFAQENANGEGEDQNFTGTWSLVIGPSRLVWELEADSYTFYAYQAGAVRIGSRGDLETEDDQITFTAREITDEGTSWREVELPDDQASTSFTYSVEQQRVFGAAGDDGAGGPGENGAEAGNGGEAEAAGGENGEAEEVAVLRLAIPGRPQFFTDYRAGAGEPVEADETQPAE